MKKKSSTNGTNSPISQNSNDNSGIYLYLKIFNGVNLAAKDRSGTSDPFIVAKLGTNKMSTNVVKKTLNPVWNQLLQFELNTDIDKELPTILKLTCWDKDKFVNDFMGEFKIELINLFKDGNPVIFDDTNTEFHQLNKRVEKDQISGEIELSIGFHLKENGNKEDSIAYLKKLYKILSSSSNFQNSSSESVLNNKENNETNLPNFEKGVVLLDIVSASDLPYEKNFVRKSFDMDPFVVCSLNETTYKTSFVRHTLNPKWNERIVFEINENDKNRNIKLSIYDNDKFSKNDFVGHCFIKIKDILELKYSDKKQNSMMDLQDVSLSDSENKTNKNNVMVIPLILNNEFWKERFKSTLVIKHYFKSYEEVKSDFWKAMFKNYDTNSDGTISYSELSMMFDSFDSSVSKNTINSMFKKMNKNIDNDSLNLNEVIEVMNNIADKKKSETSAQPQTQQNINNNNNAENETEKIINTTHCLLCHKKFGKSASDNDRIMHIALCTSDDLGKVNRIVMGNFITEAHAQRKWYAKIASFVGYGNYKIGSNNANIIVKDRRSGALIEEKIATYVRLGIRLLYTSIGSKNAIESNTIKNMFKSMSIKQGLRFNNPQSKKDIKPFIAFHDLNTDEILDPLDSFSNFNEFFYRKIKKGARKLASSNPATATSPADSRVMVFPTIDLAKELWIKGDAFTIQKLLGDSISEEESQKYNNGSLAIFRLAPQDYHRFHIPIDGTISKTHKIEGQYYTVNPMAIRSSLDVYGENVRCINYINSKQFGRVAVASIGAMMVGSIVITAKENENVKRMDELGYFAFGGSTIILIFEKNKIVFDDDLVQNSNQPIETLLFMGNSIGTATQTS